MKTVILYDTRHGFTKECADYLKELMPDADLFNLDDSYNLNEYDTLYVGTFINQGEINKRTQNFLESHRNKILRKKLYLFCCGIDKDDYNNAIQSSLDPEMFYHANYICPGGEIRYEGLTKKEKRVIKKRIGVTCSVREFHTERLKEIVKSDSKG